MQKKWINIDIITPVGISYKGFLIQLHKMKRMFADYEHVIVYWKVEGRKDAKKEPNSTSRRRV